MPSAFLLSVRWNKTMIEWGSLSPTFTSTRRKVLCVCEKLRLPQLLPNLPYVTIHSDYKINSFSSALSLVPGRESRELRPHFGHPAPICFRPIPAGWSQPCHGARADGRCWADFRKGSIVALRKPPRPPRPLRAALRCTLRRPRWCSRT